MAPQQSSLSQLASFAARTKTVWQTFKKLLSTWFSHCSIYLTYALHGAPVEEKKVVISDGRWSTAAKCLIHILPICLCVVVSALNIHGYFIGSTLQGPTTLAWQSFSRLLLQVAAKLYELLVVASLGTIVMDGLRYHLVFGPEGLPIGLVFAKLRFADISYLFSHDFRAGCSGFSQKRHRGSLGVLVALCSIIAILIGPSVAVLIIPTHFDLWPAGGVSFWLNGDLTPETFDSNLSQYQLCFEETENATRLYTPDPSVMQCPWAGFANLQSELKQQAYSPSNVLTYGAGSVQQELDFIRGTQYYPSSPGDIRYWSVTSNLAIGTVARYMAQNAWCPALFSSPQTSSGGAERNFVFREPFSSRAIVQGVHLPLVRTQCSVTAEHAYQGNERGPGNDTLLPFPIILDYAYEKNLRYYIPVPQHNVSRTSAYWIPVPTEATPTNYGIPLNKFPSAFLVLRQVQIWDAMADVTCSVQANWIPGTSVGKEACAAGLRGITVQGFNNKEGVLMNDPSVLTNWANGLGASTRSSFERPPLWPTVSLTENWLNLLTPQLAANDTGWTTLSSTIESVLSQQGDFEVSEDVNPSSPFYQINAVVASFVLDGMARMGITENRLKALDALFTCLSDEPPCEWTWDTSEWEQIIKNIIDDKATLVPTSTYRKELGKMYHIQFTISGYGIRSDTTASKLALAVLYAHTLLAILHIAYYCFTRRSSDSWSSPTDILALSRCSTTSTNGCLRNTSAGVKTFVTRQLRLRIRENKIVANGEESLQLLVDNAFGDKIEIGKAYGCRQ